MIDEFKKQYINQIQFNENNVKNNYNINIQNRFLKDVDFIKKLNN